MSRVGIIGAGSWGTALSLVLANNGHSVEIWSIVESEIEMLKEKHEHIDKLPGVKLPDSITFTTDIEETIKNMPNYFADYDTTVHFISEEELKANHSGIPHGGFVLRSGKTGWNQENSHLIEYSLKLDSNPEFTSSVLIAYARAAYRLAKEGQSGCKTVFDIAPAYLSAKSGEELRKNLL